MREKRGVQSWPARVKSRARPPSTRGDAIAVELDLVQPLAAGGRSVDERRELELDAAREGGATRSGDGRRIAGRRDRGSVALTAPARPHAIAGARDLVEVAAGEDARRLALGDVVAPRFRVAALDQEPVRAPAVARLPPHPHQMPAAAQLVAREPERQIALRERRVRIVERLPRAAIPHEHRAAAVLALRDHAFERGVLERMVLGLDRHAAVARDEARTLRNRPALEHAVELEPEVVVQPASGVLLHHELEGARALAACATPRLGRAAEVPLPLILLERHRNAAVRRLGGPLARNLAAGSTRLGQTDRDRLLAAGHLLAGPPALQRPALPLVHGLLDLLRRLLAVSRHGDLLSLRREASHVPIAAGVRVHSRARRREERIDPRARL
jgi:hypothetical protein